MKVGSGPENLPQLEDRFLFHLVDISGDRPMGNMDGVSELDVAARLATEMGISSESTKGHAPQTSVTSNVLSGMVQELENEGLLTVPMRTKDSPNLLRPTREGRRRVAQWREGWRQDQGKRDREVQRLILQELDRQWRSDPETYKLYSCLDVERFCEENAIERNIYLANAHRLIEQGKAGKQRLDGAGPDSGLMYITESGRRFIEVTDSCQRPQRDAQEAWVEVARLKRRLQIAERDLPSLIADDELRQRCEDLLAADSHHDRVIREACVILEDRVRKATGSDKSLYGVALMERTFGAKDGLLRLSELDREQTGAMHIYSGVMAFFRNAAGHNLISSYSQEDALRFVTVVDLLLKMLNDSHLNSSRK